MLEGFAEKVFRSIALGYEQSLWRCYKRYGQSIAYAQQGIKAAHTALFLSFVLSFASQNQVYYPVVAKP